MISLYKLLIYIFVLLNINNMAMARTHCDIINGVLVEMTGNENVLPEHKEGTMNCCSSGYINCSGNNILEIIIENYNNFNNPIPSLINEIVTLKTLIIKNSKIPGSLNDNLFKVGMNNLETLDLSNNFITGKIPRTIGGLRNIKKIDLSNNEISGEIPETVTSLKTITQLILKENSIIGQIPSNIGDLENLENLDLQENKLTGEIPFSIGKLTNLKYLNLALNDLSGTIPNCISKMSSLEDLYLQKNQFTGELPKSLSNMENLITINVSLNQMSGPIPPFSNKVFKCYFGYGSNKFCLEKDVEINCLNNVFEECKESSGSGSSVLYIILATIAIIIIIGISYFVYGKMKKDKEINEILEHASTNSKGDINSKEIFNESEYHNTNTSESEINLNNSQILNQGMPSPQYYPVYYNSTTNCQQVSQPQYNQIQQYSNVQPQIDMNQQVPLNLFMNQNQTPISPISAMSPMSPPISVMSPVTSAISTETRNLNAIIIASSVENNKKMSIDIKKQFITDDQIIENNGKKTDNLSPLLLPIETSNKKQHQKIPEDIINNSLTEINMNILNS